MHRTNVPLSCSTSHPRLTKSGLSAVPVAVRTSLSSREPGTVLIFMFGSHLTNVAKMSDSGESRREALALVAGLGLPAVAMHMRKFGVPIKTVIYQDVIYAGMLPALVLAGVWAYCFAAGRVRSRMEVAMKPVLPERVCFLRKSLLISTGQRAPRHPRTQRGRKWR